MDTPFEIFLGVTPGFEALLRDEALAAGFADPQVVPGGVTFQGGWPDVWRANLTLRGAGRVLARFAEFRAMHLAQLDKRSHKVSWSGILRPDVPVKVEAICRKSKIYHAGAAAQRISQAITDTVGAPVKAAAGKETEPDPDAPTGRALRLMARIEDDLVTLSMDTSGEPLHRRGHKEAVGKAPMRETLASLFLRQCGYTGTEPVLDPMCGSGTFVLEAAEIASGLMPGRTRPFAFEELANFDAQLWAQMKTRCEAVAPPAMFYGYDRDDGAVRNSLANAARAGLSDCTAFARQPISDLARPDGPPGLVIVNPPYGARIGNRKLLFGLYATLGQVLKERFGGWRLGMVTSDPGLAKATGLKLTAGSAVNFSGLTVKLYQAWL